MELAVYSAAKKVQNEQPYSEKGGWGKIDDNKF